DAATVRRFVGAQPASAHGRLAVARALLGESDRAGAAREVRAVWHSAELSAELEGVVANAFRDELTAANDIVRMDRRIAAKDFGAAMRAAKRLGAARVEVVKACEAAEASLGLSESALQSPPATVEGTNGDLLRAVNMLYALGELDLVLTFINDLAETSSDEATLNALGQLTAHYHDAQAMLILGKAALARGLALERYAFPVIGVPAYSPISPAIDPCMVFAVVRVESAFDQRDTSPANAYR